MRDDNIIVVGGGIIGASLTYWLAQAGAQVTLLEAKTRLADEGTASWASAGIVSPPARLDTPPGLLELEKRSRTLYPALVAQLKTDTGYVELGQLSLAANGAEVRGLQKRQRWQEQVGFEAHWLSPAEVQSREPLAGPNSGALYNPAAVVRAAWLCDALAEAARLKGASIKTGQPVARLQLEADHRTVTGVSLANGETIEGRQVVLAAGAWSGQWLDQQLSQGAEKVFAKLVWPVRGQMLTVRPDPAKKLPDLQHVLVGGHGYALPRNEAGEQGGVAFGATVEPTAGFEIGLTPAGYRELGLLVHKLSPALEHSPVVRAWAGVRPGSPDELPLLGPLPQLPGLWLATGHYRNGVLLAPATAEWLAEALLDGSPTALARLEPFSPGRFA